MEIPNYITKCDEGYMALMGRHLTAITEMNTHELAGAIKEEAKLNLAEHGGGPLVWLLEETAHRLEQAEENSTQRPNTRRSIQGV